MLVCGEARRLTTASSHALRAGGASGPAVLAAALRELGRARASGNGPTLDAALTALASAALRWRDRHGDGIDVSRSVLPYGSSMRSGVAAPV